MNKDLTILVVDDELTMRMIMRRILKQMGYENVIEEVDGGQALERLRFERVGLVISDWNLPRVSGLDLLKAIRADQTTAAIPVLMVTGEAKPDLVKKALEAGANHYIVKPFTARVFEHKVTQLLANLPG